MSHDIQKQHGIPYKETVYSIRHHTVPSIHVDDQRIEVRCPKCDERYYVDIGYEELSADERAHIAERATDLLKESCDKPDRDH